MARWTDQEITRLKALARQRMSSAMIGEKLGRSKGSVIGKCDRENISLDPSPELCAKRNTDALKAFWASASTEYRKAHAARARAGIPGFSHRVTHVKRPEV